MKQMALDVALAPEPTLAGFVPAGNAAAVQHERLWSEGRTRSPVPVYLWGPAGAGKTHLLRGAAHALRDQGLAVGWLDAGAAPGQAFDPAWDAVLLDEVQAFGPGLQHTAFNWFIHAMTPQQGEPCWVLSAGSLPVTDLPLREDLRTRLGWGQMFGLQPLSEDDVQRALRQEAQDRGLDLSDEVLRFMLSRFSRDLGSLSQLLAMLDDYALETRRAITVPLLKQMMNDS